MGAGIGVYPNGWDSPEVQQACGYISKAYLYLTPIVSIKSFQVY